ncbi:MAG: CMGC/CDK protein kinase [Amphiamblys sp. WSBS2006]|nr:MAG: CMGC/CDK protein kinase [Amphiamblys sp. WSBS2006]
MSFVSIDDYRIIRKIGEGTFGEVYSGIDTRTNQKVALKKVIIHDKKDGFPIPALREISILQHLKHPSILPLLAVAGTEESSLDGGFIALVFPYIKHDLLGILRSAFVFSEPYRKYCIQSMLRGIGFLHQNSVLHRDIKASNIFVDEKGEVSIADFGLSRFKNSKKQKYTPGVFTCWYRPPEILLGQRNYSEAADIWALGCLAAEILTGEVFLRGKSEIDQLGLINKCCGEISEKTFPGVSLLPDYTRMPFSSDQPTILDRLRGVDSGGAALVEEMLQIDPAKRKPASELLKHRYFSAEPLPRIQNDILSFPSSHEYDIKVDALHK